MREQIAPEIVQAIFAHAAASGLSVNDYLRQALGLKHGESAEKPVVKHRRATKRCCDSINLACAVRRGITDIATYDTDFLHTPNLKIWQPTDV